MLLLKQLKDNLPDTLRICNSNMNYVHKWLISDREADLTTKESSFFFLKYSDEIDVPGMS